MSVPAICILLVVVIVICIIFGGVSAASTSTGSGGGGGSSSQTGILDAIVYNHAEIMKLHLSSSQGGMGYEGYYTTEEPGDWAKEAVKYVFDDGGVVARHRLMFMYDVSGGFYSDWHETQHFILQYKTTRFFDMW